MAQERYLERKGERRVKNQRRPVVSMDKPEDLLTVYPRQTSMALQKRKLYKESRGTMARVLERHFVIDNSLITFFNYAKDANFTKNASLDGAFVFIETRESYT